MFAQKSPSSNNAVERTSETRVSSSKRRRKGQTSFSASSSFSSFRNTNKRTSKKRLLNALKAYGESFVGFSREEEEGRREAIWSGLKKRTSILCPPSRAAKENGPDFDAIISAKTSKEEEKFSSADFGEECVGVGIDAECPIEEEEELVLLSSTTREVEVEEGVVAAATAKSGKQKREFPALFYVAPFFLWGTSMVSMKEVLPLTSPMFVATVRLIPAGLILILWAVSKNRKFPKNAKGWLAVSLFALVDGAMFQGCLAEGLAKTSAGLGSVIIDSQPLTVAILASIFFGETLGAAGIGGLALGVVGLSLLEIPSETLAGFMSKSSSGGGADGGSASTFLQSFAAHPFDSGEFWMLLAAQSMAVGTVMVRWVVKYVDPVMATGLHMFLGGIPLLIYSLVSELDVYENIFGDGGGALGIADGANLLYASVFGGALAYSLFFYFASSGNLTKLSSLTFLTPVFAVVGGYFALGETLDAQQLVGAAVTLGGIYLVNKNAGGNDGT